MHNKIETETQADIKNFLTINIRAIESTSDKDHICVLWSFIGADYCRLTGIFPIFFKNNLTKRGERYY